ncbi:LytR family transcriptional regulator [Cryobacterium sp. TMS1-20-1]|uniref:LCP family protein n=1 Tax=Cryobacterium sp. TMS1-20-1 TaxID=1259223 RepID=UPI00106C2CD6|nr:LCP family protein [Cryobacterium sp. TMS1-20-1]TFC77580.1 LytR family transcriptional regulator [Cryobacterium sp. TMS1-20-1]
MSDQLRPRSAGSKNLKTVARHGRLKKSNAAVAVAKFIAGSVAVVLVSGFSVAAIAAYDVVQSASPSVHLANESNGPVPSIGAIDGGVNMLVVGSDSRVGQEARFGPEDSTGDLNDVTMLLHISEDHSNASVISFPRDMFVAIPSCPKEDGSGSHSAMSSQKINTTLTYGGLACTVLTVEKLTGLSIPFAAEVQFSGVMAMSSAVGGVPVCVATRIEDEYTGTFLDPGEHTLEGYEALQFLRTRHGLGDGGDLTRINNQQLFMSSLVRTIKSADTLSDPTKVYALAKAVTANMRLSDSLSSVTTLASIAIALKDIDLDQVVFAQVPTGSTTGGVKAVQPAFDNLFEAVAADQPLTLSGTTGRGTEADPNAPVEAEPEPSATTDPAATADPSATADPTATEAPVATEDPGVVLSESVTGQTAGDYTCTRGRTLENQ